MKIILAVGLAGLLGFMLFTMLNAEVPFTRKAHSQIYIHGTPVCVTQRSHEIVAQVGKCDGARAYPDREFTGEVPFHGHPGRELPPGHPPIDGNMFPEENRRVLI